MSSNSNIELINIMIPYMSIPKIKGNNSNIKYIAISGNSNIITNGGYYANIKHINNSNCSIMDGLYGYYVQEDDYTILTNGINIYIYDPIIANHNVLDKGKIIIIKNLSKINNVSIIGENNCIYDFNPYILEIGLSIMLQNDGIKWYILYINISDIKIFYFYFFI